MKRILITGIQSYVGKNVAHYLQEYNVQKGKELYKVDLISLREEKWEQCDFSAYETVFHVAGIAHVDTGKITEAQKKKYYDINRDLTYKVAQKAKEQGVKQFIFMSSVIVYGGVQPGTELFITEDTPVNPENAYGDSKVQAEKLLNSLKSENFQIAVVRAPMIYGKNCKGNFSLLEKIAKYSPVFVNIVNARSALYVENLAEFVRLLIDSQKGGVYLPQNAEYFVTSQVVKGICQARGKKILLLKMPVQTVKVLGRMPGRVGQMVNKAFGSLMIDQELSRRMIDDYQLYSLKESIQRIEKER